jgi:hypothetical protein
MKINRVIALLVLMIFGASFNFLSPALGDNSDTAMFRQAHDLLHKALAADSDAAPSNAERIDLLNQAEKILKNAPPGNYGHHRKDAIQFIRSSKLELQNGDPDKKAMDYIRSADSEVRDIE